MSLPSTASYNSPSLAVTSHHVPTPAAIACQNLPPRPFSPALSDRSHALPQRFNTQQHRLLQPPPPSPTECIPAHHPLSTAYTRHNLKTQLVTSRQYLPAIATSRSCSQARALLAFTPTYRYPLTLTCPSSMYLATVNHHLSTVLHSPRRDVTLSCADDPFST